MVGKAELMDKKVKRTKVNAYTGVRTTDFLSNKVDIALFGVDEDGHTKQVPRGLLFYDIRGDADGFFDVTEPWVPNDQVLTTYLTYYAGNDWDFVDLDE